MKLTHIQIILAAAFALAGAFPAGAQSNRVPGDTDYPQFSQFITDRNIFNPDRYRRNSGTRPPRPTPTHPPRTAGAPEFTFVGVMSYQKGQFGFFDGNSSELRQVLAVGGSIAGYTVQELTSSAVKLLGPDKKEIELKLGVQMRKEGGNWLMAGQVATPGAAATTTSSAGDGSSTAPAGEQSVAPSAAIQGNDVLKRLMEKRAQEK
ncbi:MAG TPA: hypothetical protein VIK53_01115 [Verrucomicrobiae bacterium]